MSVKNNNIDHAVIKPWGSYTNLASGLNYLIKKIEVNPSSSLSLQLHNHRSEHWIVVEGIATVVNGDNSFDLTQDQSTYIAVNTKHRLQNKTNAKLVIIEIQYGDHLAEDDIIRFEDDYNRI